MNSVRIFKPKTCNRKNCHSIRSEYCKFRADNFLCKKSGSEVTKQTLTFKESVWRRLAMRKEASLVGWWLVSLVVGAVHGKANRTSNLSRDGSKAVSHTTGCS